jgi:hypothetical protein
MVKWDVRFPWTVKKEAGDLHSLRINIFKQWKTTASFKGTLCCSRLKPAKCRTQRYNFERWDLAEKRDDVL